MIRGVNRQTIEIRETGNPFFERAILFVTESGTKLSQQQLTAQWNSFLKTSERPPAARAPRPSNAAQPPKLTPRAPNARKREAFTNLLQSEGDEGRRAASAADRGRFPYAPRGAKKAETGEGLRFRH